MQFNQSRRGTAAGIVALAVVALVLTACTGQATTAPTTQSPTLAPTILAPAATTVDVTLQEWSIAPSLTTLPAGSVTFNVKNISTKEQHEMIVVKTDLGLLELPTGSDGKVNEEGANHKSLGEVSETDVGASGSLTLDLTPGKYLLICNIVDPDGTAHYGKGMAAAITVQ